VTAVLLDCVDSFVSVTVAFTIAAELGSDTTPVTSLDCCAASGRVNGPLNKNPNVRAIQNLALELSPGDALSINIVVFLLLVSSSSQHCVFRISASGPHSTSDD
jgi:hypothetical protein